MRLASMLLPVAFSFLIFALLAKPAAPEAVLDIAGEVVRPGIEYYVLPVIRGRGGGLTLGGRTDIEGCPRDVSQALLGVDRGIPLKFSPKNSKVGFVSTSSDLNIKFSLPPVSICMFSGVWRLDGFDEETKQFLVTTGGVSGDPGCDTINNWFKIEKYQDDYKIVFCPSVCDISRVSCGDIGIFIDEKGERRLVLSNEPFPVFFVEKTAESKLASVV